MLFPLLVFVKGRVRNLRLFLVMCPHQEKLLCLCCAAARCYVSLLVSLNAVFLFLSYTVTNGSSHSPTALNGAPSPPNGYSNGPSSSSSSSLANQQLPPACGARQLSKLKRFLTTLQQFGNDISPEIGERVRTLVLGLVVSG